MAEEGLVDGSGYISDESSFYGDEELKSRFDELVDHFDETEYWTSHSRQSTTIAALERRKERSLLASPDKFHPVEQLRKANLIPPSDLTSLIPKDKGKGRASAPPTPSPEVEAAVLPFDDDQHVPDAHYHSSETVVQFLKRLPPLESSGVGPWIWIHNPQAQSGTRKSDVPGLMSCGSDLLEAYMVTRARIVEENPGKPQGSITRKLTPFRNQLKGQILDLAVEKGVTTGKWMLFPNLAQATETWSKICTAVAESRLGPTAKIATDSNEPSCRTRLICIYTSDFTDMDDVARVVTELAELGMAKRDGSRGIYYKCDAYTWLGINGGNDYGLQASLYSSKEVLASGDATNMEAAGKRKVLGGKGGPLKKRTKFAGSTN